jgi:hypothetical protein
MTFSAYVDRQKFLIRQRHEGETYLLGGNKIYAVRDSERILIEMENLKGLNKAERLSFSRKGEIKRSAHTY